MTRSLRIAVPLLALLLPFQAAAQDGLLPQALQPLAGQQAERPAPPSAATAP